MEEKDLAMQERIKAKFEENIINLIHKYKEGNLSEFAIENVKVDIKKADKAYIVSFGGYELCRVLEDGVKYDISKLEDFKKKAEELSKNGAPDLEEELGLPDIEYLKYLEKEETKENQKQEKDNKVKDEGEEKEENEKDEEEKPELEEDDKEKIEEIAKEYNLKTNQIVHISKNKKITKNEKFRDVAEWSKKYDDIYMLQGENAFEWKTIGVKESKKEEIQNQKKIGGKTPDIKIKRIDGEKIEEIKPLSVYELDNKTAVAIVKDKFGRPEALYCRQEGGDKKTFWGTIIPEVNGKNVRQKEPQIREFMDHRYNSGNDLSRKSEELEKQENLEQRGLPSEEEGVQVAEIEGNANQNRVMRKEEIKEDLYKRLGISEKMKGAMPGYLDYMENKIDIQAEKILELMDNNETITYEEAIEKTGDERESGGRTLGENRRNSH